MTTDTVSTFLALLTVAANITVIVVAILAVMPKSPATAERLRREREAMAPAALGVAWLAAAIATAGSLYYSEVAHFTPCVLCWYQRIGMYPLVVVLGIAALRRDRNIWRYVVPVVGAASAISIYHYQLERFPNQTSITCSADVPCTVVWIWKFHYISIPFMALSAFVLIAVCLLIARPSKGSPAS